MPRDVPRIPWSISHEGRVSPPVALRGHTSWVVTETLINGTQVGGLGMETDPRQIALSVPGTVEADGRLTSQPLLEPSSGIAKRDSARSAGKERRARSSTRKSVRSGGPSAINPTTIVESPPASGQGTDEPSASGQRQGLKWGVVENHIDENSPTAVPPSPFARRGDLKVSEDSELTGMSSYGSPRAWLWWAGILLFGFGDTLTSLLVFGQGGREGNMLLGLVLTLVGRSIWAFLAAKVVAILTLLLLSRWQPGVELAIGWAMLVVGVFLVAQNSTILLFGQ